MITLLTDFGIADYFVAALKGSILSVYPQARLIDITHEIPAHDIAAAAFTLQACCKDFPKGTVHLAVVDPGVGSSRRPIVAQSHGHLFVGPDNGLFTFVLDQGSETRIFHATETKLFRERVSATFHGRDIFAPLAAHLDRGLDPEETGPEISDYHTLPMPQPVKDGATGSITGEVIHIDRFGNCITNLTTNEIDLNTLPREAFLVIGSERVTHFGDHFAQANAGAPFAYLGSAGYFEIGLWCASAASRLGISRGMPCTLETGLRGSLK